MNYKNYLIRKNIKNALENVLQFSFMVIAIVPYKIYQALNKKNKQEKAEEKRAKKKVEGIYSDLRFYTRKDLEFRLTKVLTDNNCDLVDSPEWFGEPEFIHDGCRYSFATFVFRKNVNV